MTWSGLQARTLAEIGDTFERESPEIFAMFGIFAYINQEEDPPPAE